MLFEAPIRRNDAIWRRGECRKFAHRTLRLRHLLARILQQCRLMLECIHLAYSALHEEEDATLRLGSMMLRFRGQWIWGTRNWSCRRCARTQQVEQGQ